MRLAMIIGALAVAVLAGVAGMGLEAATAVRPGPTVVTVTTVCHSAEEDSPMTDCDYRNGAWHRR